MKIGTYIHSGGHIYANNSVAYDPEYAWFMCVCNGVYVNESHRRQR